MKHFTLILSLLFAVASRVSGQGKIPSSIFIIDPQSNSQVEATSDPAILFKTSLVNLVTNTPMAKLQATLKFGPGKRSIIINQADPQTNGNAYQMVLQRTFLGQANIVYTFLYNVDQNKLYFYNPDSQNWIEQVIQGNNVLNLNNCQTYGTFNQLNVQPAAQQIAAVPAADNNIDAPVDTAVSVPAAPPALPDYEQPECPEEGFLWQPGYWAYSLPNNDYYWVPGVWVAPPTVGLLWTPPYWGFDRGLYVFHTGYWGNNIGFYGGIDYGYGYGGVGFVGGEWYDGYFRYNTAIVRVGPRFHYVYEDRSVYRERSRYRYSFNGRGGYMARPNEREIRAMHERHIMATNEQIRNQRAAREDRGQFASHAGGRPGNLSAAKAPERQGNAGTVPGDTRGAGSRPGGGGQAGARNEEGNQGAAGTRPAGIGNRPGNTPGTVGSAPGGQGVVTKNDATAGQPGAPGRSPSGPPGAPGARPGTLGVKGGKANAPARQKFQQPKQEKAKPDKKS